MATLAMVRWRSTPLVVMLSSRCAELSVQRSAGVQSRLIGSQPGAPGMGPLNLAIWRDYYFADALYPSVLKHPLKVEGGAAE